MKLAALAVLIVATSSCKTQEETLVGKPPASAAVEQAEPRPTAPEQPRVAPARLTIASWPYVEPGLTFTLIWTGGNKRAPLHAAPDPNSPLLGDVTWDNGERVHWQDTAVGLYVPRSIKANEEWFVEGPVYTDGFLVDQEYAQIEVKKGERMEIWGYAGDLQCHMSRRGKIITGPCPPVERFSGLGRGRVPAEWYMPEQKIWWIQITGGNLDGWVPVDDRMTVDIVAR